MKFQLFGRLRDNGEPEDQGVNDSLGPNTRDSMNNFGGGLQRTVENLFDQGYSEDEIFKELQGQYSEEELQNAINQAVKSSATSQNDGPQPMTPYEGEQENVSPMDEGFSSEEPQPQENMNNPQPPLGDNMNNNQIQNPQPPQNQAEAQGSSDVEELIETIVAENFERVEKEFENAYSEIDEMKEKMEELEERVHDLEVRDDEDQTQFIQKMDDIEDDINEYQSRIGGLEKAFQQVLPSLVDNVRDLTQLVQEIKQERGIDTQSDVSQEDIEGLDMEDWD